MARRQSSDDRGSGESGTGRSSCQARPLVMRIFCQACEDDLSDTERTISRIFEGKYYCLECYIEKAHGRVFCYERENSQYLGDHLTPRQFAKLDREDE